MAWTPNGALYTIADLHSRPGVGRCVLYLINETLEAPINRLA